MTAPLRSYDVGGRGLPAARRVLRTRHRRVAALALLGVVLVSVAAALSFVAVDANDGGRKAAYLAYRSAEEQRGPAEARLREAFSALDAAADKSDRQAARLTLIVRMLEIGRRDPLLEVTANQSEVNRLASEAATVSVDGEFARRRADRALALAIGVEPTFDVLFDLGAKTTAQSG